MNDLVKHRQPAPRAESYLPAPEFEYSPSQKEIDFAQLLAADCDVVEALYLSSMVNHKEYTTLPRRKLYSLATRLLETPAIQERYEYYRKLHRASMAATTERILQELACTAFADFAQLYHPDDGPLIARPNPLHDPDNPGSQPTIYEPEWRAGDPITNPHQIPRHLRAAVKEWCIDDKGVMRAKLHSKSKALQLLGDVVGTFDEANKAKAPKINVSIGDMGGRQEAAPAAPASLPPDPDSDEYDDLCDEYGPLHHYPECLE